MWNTLGHLKTQRSPPSVNVLQKEVKKRAVLLVLEHLLVLFLQESLNFAHGVAAQPLDHPDQIAQVCVSHAAEPHIAVGLRSSYPLQ